jgi:AMMECR1 domain-containing protein
VREEAALLRATGASFVTLRRDGDLRGCVGTLLAQLQPLADGLILEFSARRATFLPQVWEALPSARELLAQLKAKAGLARNFWSDELRISRYAVRKWAKSRA